LESLASESAESPLPPEVFERRRAQLRVARRVGADGKKFKIDPQRLLYSPQWKHNGTPPDFHLSLVQHHPEQWINTANLTLLGALRRRAPEAIDWEQLTAAGIISQLDAFEAAQGARPARRHLN
jgi:hypothetical protein